MGGTERPEPDVELKGGGAENWGREVLKAEEVTGAGAGARGGAIVETAAEGTNEGVAEVIIGGGSGATAAGKGGEYAGDDMLGVARGLDKANETGVAEAAVDPAVLGGGVPGGVASIPLSSIIFLQLQKPAPAASGPHRRSRTGERGHDGNAPAPPPGPALRPLPPAAGDDG